MANILTLQKIARYYGTPERLGTLLSKVRATTCQPAWALWSAFLVLQLHLKPCLVQLLLRCCNATTHVPATATGDQPDDQSVQGAHPGARQDLGPGSPAAGGQHAGVNV